MPEFKNKEIQLVDKTRWGRVKWMGQDGIGQDRMEWDEIGPNGKIECSKP